jgi:hypothetical protein
MGRPRDDQDAAQDMAHDLAVIAAWLGSLKGEAHAWFDDCYDAPRHRLENAHTSVEAAAVEARRRVPLNESRRRRATREEAGYDGGRSETDQEPHRGGVVAEAASEWRLLTYHEVRDAVLERVGIELKGTFDGWARLGDVSGYLLEQGLPMATSIVVNERRHLLPGGLLLKWVVGERTERNPEEVPEDEKRRVVADEQLETFRRFEEISEAVRQWRVA